MTRTTLTFTDEDLQDLMHSVGAQREIVGDLHGDACQHNPDLAPEYAEELERLERLRKRLASGRRRLARKAA